MSLADIMLAHLMYHEKEVEEWKRTRSMMFIMVKLWGDPKKTPATAEEFFPLPGDEAKTEIDEETLLKQLEEFKKVHNL